LKLEYKRELDHNYMILEEAGIEEKDGYEIYMMEENRIPGLLKCTIQRMNQIQRFCYEITSRQSMEVLMERKRLTHGDLVQLLKGIQRAVAGAREYLLDVNHLMMSPEYMYLNVDQGVPELCYFPYYDRPIQEQFFDLAEYLLGKLDRQDRAGVELGYEIYKMAGEENCSLEELLSSELVRSEARPASAERVRLFRESSEDFRGNLLRVAETASTYGNEPQKKTLWGWRKRQTKEKKPQEEYEIPGEAENVELFLQQEEERELFPEYNQTECRGTRLLSGITERGIILYGTKPSLPVFAIHEDSFIIGKKKDAVDGWIDDSTISRIHARVERRDKEFYLVDLNSTNGTYVNGRLLGMNESVRLRAGDTVRFAEIEYTVGI